MLFKLLYWLLSRFCSDFSAYSARFILTEVVTYSTYIFHRATRSSSLNLSLSNKYVTYLLGPTPQSDLGTISKLWSILNFIGLSFRHLQFHWTLHNAVVYHLGEGTHRSVGGSRGPIAADWWWVTEPVVQSLNPPWFGDDPLEMSKISQFLRNSWITIFESAESYEY